jgi:DNA mismatch repair protein PMS2
MKVIGQFNHGFILASLSKGQTLELYIIDQHAADEKYNFEKLFSTFNPKIQRLISPMNLALSLSEEHYCQMHQKALLNCGFHLHFDEQAEPGKRFSLTASAIFEGSIFDANGKHFRKFIFYFDFRLVRASVCAKR